MLALADLLEDPDWMVEFAAERALISIGPAAAPAVRRLIPRLRAKNAVRVRWTATILGAIGPAAKAAVPALVTASKTHFEAAMQALGKIAPVKAIALLAGRLDDEKGAEREKSIRLLAGIGAPTVPRLSKLLRKGDATERRNVLEVFRRVGPAAAGAVPALIETLNTEDADQALLTLEAIGPAARSALPKLLAWPDTKESWQRRRLQEAIRSLRGDL